MSPSSSTSRSRRFFVCLCVRAFLLQDLEAEQERRKRSKEQQQQKKRRGTFSFRSAALAGGLIDFQRRLLELREAAEAAAAEDSAALFEEDANSKEAAAAAAENQPTEMLADLVIVFKALLKQLETSMQQSKQQAEQHELPQEDRTLHLEALSWFGRLEGERPLRRLLWLMGLECVRGDTNRWSLPKEVSAATWRDRLQVFEAMHCRRLDVSQLASHLDIQ